MNRAIAWFAENHVAANLLMAAILIGGLMTAPRIKQTIMPDFDFDYVLYSNYERQVAGHFAGHYDVAWNSPLKIPPKSCLRILAAV